MSSAIVQRHYPKIDELVRRTAGDIAPAALDKQVLGKAMLEKIIDVGPESPRLISSAHGEIARLLFTVPAYAVRPTGGEANPIATAYQHLLAKMPIGIDYLVLTHKSVETTVEQWFESAGISTARVLSIPDHLHFSVWAEDGYVVTSDNTTENLATFLASQFSCASVHTQGGTCQVVVIGLS